MLTTFPNRVWFETKLGWASREVGKYDRIRRTDFLAGVQFRLFQKKLAEANKKPDTVLRRGT